MEMDNEIFKQNNADQVKGNATKLEYTNYWFSFFNSNISDTKSNYS